MLNSNAWMAAVLSLGLASLANARRDQVVGHDVYPQTTPPIQLGARLSEPPPAASARRSRPRKAVPITPSREVNRSEWGECR